VESIGKSVGEFAILAFQLVTHVGFSAFVQHLSFKDVRALGVLGEVGQRFLGFNLTLIFKFNLVTACSCLHIEIHVVNILQIMLKLANIKLPLHKKVSALLFDVRVFLLSLLFQLIV
jgi:hypothetical protein